MSGWAIRRHSPEAHRGEPWGSALGIYREHWGKLGGIVPPKGRKKAHSANVGLFCKLLIYFILLAEWTGLEPATPGVTGRYSNQLNYHSRFRICMQMLGVSNRSQRNRPSVPSFLQTANGNYKVKMIHLSRRFRALEAPSASSRRK